MCVRACTYVCVWECVPHSLFPNWVRPQAHSRGLPYSTRVTLIAKVTVQLVSGFYNPVLCLDGLFFFPSVGQFSFFPPLL